ncbi:MAG: 50S ribosomal protein L9 [Nocardioidaceae bacterium]
MKLILTQEVSALGAPGDVVEVKDGFGRNYLMPRGLAIRWTRGAEKQISSIKKARSVREVRDLGHANEIKHQLESRTVTVPAQAGASGRLFGAVTVADIVEAVKAGGGPDIDKRRIQVANPIKAIGSHFVHVKVHDDVTATVNLEVVAST